MNENQKSFEEINISSKARTNNIGNSSWLLSLPPQQFTLLSALIGILLINYLNINEQNSLGNFLVGIGQTLLTAAAQGELV
ncbi:hypothetical protein, partial [Desulfofarcimen acetoxidans]|jgi:hypothetical protein|uniref:hypothetical protein n=1 Tax=Desulfofarcimen acetoxidans TaxID=58138 RepID=UPI00019E5154